MFGKRIAMGLALGIAMGPGAWAADPCCVVQPETSSVMTPQGTPPPMIVPISPFGGPAMVPVWVPVPVPALVAPVAVPPPVPASMPVARGVYTVQKGARLWVVAQRTKTRFADLILLNPNLEIQGKLPAGTRVLLPIPGSW